MMDALDLPSDIDKSASSGSEYDVNKELDQGLDSSDEELFLFRKCISKRHPSQTKKTRFEALPPNAKSTPRDDVYRFTGEDEGDTEAFLRKRPHSTVADCQDTPRTTAQKSITLNDLMKKMTAMETTLLTAIRTLGEDNEKLRQANKTQASKIDRLTERVIHLEQPGTQHTSQEPKIKSTNHIRAAIRVALKHAEEVKGMEIRVYDGIDSPSNQKLVEYVNAFAKVHVPDMQDASFRDGLHTIFKSRRQKQSRKIRGKDEQHANLMRKSQRKSVKCQNRLAGLDACDLPGDIHQKYKAVMKNTTFMSSEESDVDETGQKVLSVRSREWESRELRKVKRLADKSYVQERKVKTPRLTRIKGPPSIAQAPQILTKEQEWTVVQYGQL